MENSESPLIAEQSVLACMLINNDTIDVVTEILGEDPSCFVDPFGAELYSAFLDLRSRNMPADLITITEWFRDRGHMVAGILSELDNCRPTSHNVQYYAGLVKALHDKRRVVTACQQAISMLRGDADVAEVLSGLESAVTTIAQGSTKRTMRSVSQIIPAIIRDIQEKRLLRTTITGVPTGIPKMDHLLLGLKPGTLNIIGARPSVGKSALAANIAYNAAKEGHPVLMFSMEMQAESVVKRLISIDQNMPYADFCNRADVAAKNQKLSTAVKSLGDLNLYIDDTAYLSMWSFRSKVRQFCRKFTDPMPLVIADYLQLYEVDRKKKNRYEAIGELTRDIKIMAGELKIPVLMLSQLGREADVAIDPYQCLPMFRESGNIEQDCDVAIVMLKRLQESQLKKFPDYLCRLKLDPAKEIDNTINCAVVKNRDGAIGATELYFQKRTQRMLCLEMSPAPQAPSMSYRANEDDDLI